MWYYKNVSRKSHVKRKSYTINIIRRRVEFFFLASSGSYCLFFMKGEEYLGQQQQES